MKRIWYTIGLMSLSWCCCVAPPVSKNTESEPDMDIIMHYHHYLKEVIGALENDPEFKKKLETANEVDIKSGKIANELEFVSHHVRNQLDEFKRQELTRLRTLNKQQHDLSENDISSDPTHGHIDHMNPHTFEVADLKKLIRKTMENLEDHDRKRREKFKEYEMQKEYDKLEKLNHTNGDEREKLEKEFKEKEERHKQHEPLHEPGHKAQLEEVWHEQDHMEQEFDPKTFFMMHDLDSNGLLDQDEVKAFFIKELNKMYDSNAPEDDMVERAEEMERMREAVFSKIDTNKDGFIDYSEFLAQTKTQDYQEDHGWKSIDQEKPYTNEELEAYIREQQRLHPPPPGYYPPPGAYHPNMPPPQPGAYHPPPPNYQGYQPNPPPYQTGQGQYYPTQVHPNQLPPQQFQGQPQQVAPNQGQPNIQAQPPQVNYQQQQQQGMNNQQQPPQVQQNIQQPPQGQQNYQQPPQGQQNYQQPPQGQQNIQQPPQGQQNYQQPPQGQQNFQQPSQGQQNYQQPPQGQLNSDKQQINNQQPQQTGKQ